MLRAVTATSERKETLESEVGLLQISIWSKYAWAQS